MPIKGISKYSVSLQFSEVGGDPRPGSVVSYIDESGHEHHFVVTFYAAGIKSFGIKPISGIGKINPGILPGSYLRSLDKSFYIKVGNNSVTLSDGSKIHQLAEVTDVRESFISNRHSLIIDDARGIRWNQAFMDGSDFAYSACDLSFLSVVFPYEKEVISGISNHRPSPVIALSKQFGIMQSSDVKHYKNHPVLFLDRNANDFYKVQVSEFVNLGDFAVNNLSYAVKDESFLRELQDYTLCVFASNDYLNNKNVFASFAANIGAFNSKDVVNDLLSLNTILSCGLVRAKTLANGSGYEFIKNVNSIDNTISNGCFDGDYINEFTPTDDLSLLFLKYDGKYYCVGNFTYENTEYVSGCNMINGRYVSEGRNSFGEFSKSLIDSENYCSINKVKMFFDQKFFDVVNAIVALYGVEQFVHEPIGIVSKTIDGNDINRDYQSYDPVVCLHNYIVGDTVPSYLDGKYRLNDLCDNYVPGSAFLDRDIRPLTKNINSKGLAEKSTGVAFRPSYAYKKNQNKSFSIAVSGFSDLLIPFKNTIKDILVDYNFTSLESVDLGLKIVGDIESSQIKNLYISGVSCIEDNSVLSGSDGVLKYMRKDGSVSNVVRHNDALLLLSLSLQFLSFLNNNNYSKNMSSRPSLVFEFGKSGRSKAVKLAFALYCNNKNIYQLNENDNIYYVHSHDRDLAIIEIKRLIKSLRNFYGSFSNSVYQDLLKLINFYDMKYKNSAISSMKDKIVDAAHLLTKFDFYVKGLGDPLVDVFGISENSSGKVNIEKISGLSLNNKDLKNYIPSNVSKRVSGYSVSKSMSHVSISPIWSGAVLFSGTISSPYSPSGQYAVYDDVNNALESIILRWISGIDSLKNECEGYIIESKDDVGIVDENEISARNFILVSSLKNKSDVLLKDNFKIGISYACITDVEFRGKSTVHFNNGYILHNRRIFSAIVKPSIDAGARVILQEQNVDQLIIDYFSNIDSAINGSASKKSEDALCFFENVYNPDYVERTAITDIGGQEVAVFEGVKFSFFSQNAFANYDTYKGEYYFDSRIAYKESYAPQGADIVDLNVDLDRLNDRKRSLYVAQNLISEQISSVIDQISSYEITQNVNKSLLIYGLRSSALNAPKRLTANLFGHNFFNFVMVKLGEEVQDSYFTHNTFLSPYAGLKANRIHAFTTDDNFVMKKIFDRSSSVKDCYVERSILADWGKLKNLYPIPPNEYATADGININKGEGSNNNDDDIIYRFKISNLPNIKSYTINGII